MTEMQRKYQKGEPAYFFQLIEPNLNTEEITKKTKDWDYYKIFYRPFSAAVHGTDSLRLLEERADGTIGFGPVRVSEGGRHRVSLAASLLHSAGVALAEHYSLVLEKRDTTPSS